MVSASGIGRYRGGGLVRGLGQGRRARHDSGILPFHRQVQVIHGLVMVSISGIGRYRKDGLVRGRSQGRRARDEPSNLTRHR